MPDEKKYQKISDHDLLTGLAINSDAQTKHLEKINGRLDDHCKDLVRLKIIVAVILVGGTGGLTAIISKLIGG